MKKIGNNFQFEKPTTNTLGGLLDRKNVPINARGVGDSHSRTMYINISDGKVVLNH